ncbi:hypothetical protein BCR34DRAFT_481807 [Clohesyomyces aquaticus]|uniref:Zn(2)-C6 fungal-type domain-containing protein n=1 Tax=Clohesyomyces aquaticus TaxID=1231657 RepID=A0A1Y1ZRR2_9PLEO|nr:hypothetical protein BCR34DRAFT_481807 [Clohesyomyces aquaticus]
MAPTSSKKVQVRKKAWKPKTRTGCITCRIRRIKCDEARPECGRCSTTGRKCDGYTSPAQPLPSEAHHMVVSPKSSILPMGVPVVQLGSAQEREALYFYRQHSAFELAGSYDSRFWQFAIPCAFHSNAAIRHAVVALATLHRKLIAGNTAVVPDDASDNQMRFALEQCNRSIRAVVTSPAERTMTDRLHMLSLTILFHFLACIQGHQSLAFEHLRSGLRILREVDSDIASGMDCTSEYPISLDAIRPVFVDMDVQARGIMSDEDLAAWEPKPITEPILNEGVFKTVHQAQFYFDATFNSLVALIQEMDVHPPKSDSEMKVFREEIERLRIQFEAGSRLLHEFFLRQSVLVGEEARIGLQLIQSETLIFLAAATNCRQPRETRWAPLEPEFEKIVNLAAQLYGADPWLSLPSAAACESDYDLPTDSGTLSRPVFSARSKVVPGLYVVATRSRNIALRKRAIAMLLKYPRREGVWDGVLAGRVCYEILCLEEPASDGQTTNMEADYKIMDVAIQYTGLRGMAAELKTERQYREGEPGVWRHFAW